MPRISEPRAVDAVGERPREQPAVLDDRSPQDCARCSPIVARNEGQRLLLEAPGSGAELARRVGTSRQCISLWRRGDAMPDHRARERLEAELGIPARAWDRRPGLTLELPADLEGVLDQLLGDRHTPDRFVLERVLGRLSLHRAALADVRRLLRELPTPPEAP